MRKDCGDISSKRWRSLEYIRRRKDSFVVGKQIFLQFLFLFLVFFFFKRPKAIPIHYLIDDKGVVYNSTK